MDLDKCLSLKELILHPAQRNSFLSYRVQKVGGKEFLWVLVKGSLFLCRVINFLVIYT